MFVALTARTNILLSITLKYVVIYYFVHTVHTGKRSYVCPRKAEEICDIKHIHTLGNLKIYLC